MPKQVGIRKFAGKIGEEVGYYSQNGGWVTRTQNPAMSDRVKNDPSFANTRYNAAEFGAAGNLAGVLVSSVTQRWRYMLNPIATGLLCKDILGFMKLNATSPWGQRELESAHYEEVQSAYNTYSKNEMLPEIVSALEGTSVNSTTHKIVTPNDSEVTMSEDTAAFLMSQGVDGVITSSYYMAASVPTFDPSLGKFVKSTRIALRLMSVTDGEAVEGEPLLSNNINVPSSRGVYYNPTNQEGEMRGMLVVVTPYKVIGNTKYILQELCSAYWKSIPVQA